MKKLHTASAVSSIVRALVLVLLAGGVCAPRAERDPGVLVWPRHPVYDLLERLELNGRVRSGMLATRPLTAAQVGAMLDSADTDGLWRADRERLEVFRREFAPRENGRGFSADGSRVRFANDKAGMSFGPSFRVTTTAYGDGNDVNLLREQGVETFGRIGPWFSFYGNMHEVYEQGDRLGPPAANSPERGWAGWSRRKDSPYSNDTSEGYVALSWPLGGVWLGRISRSWGPGRRGQVFLSDKPPATAQVAVMLHPWDWLRYRYIHVQLESAIVDSGTTREPYPGQVFTRYYGKFLVAQRIEIAPTNLLRLGFNQSVVYGASTFDLGYLVPLVDLRNVQHAKGDRDNAQLALDATLFWPRYTAWYGALFIDELSMTKMFDDEQNRNWVAVQVGTRVSDCLGYVPGLMVRLEYTRVNPRVYAHRYPWSTFETAGIGLYGRPVHYPMGYWLGENSDDLYAEVSYEVGGSLSLSLWGERTRKGESPPVPEAYGTGTYSATPFLWGDVETTWRSYASASWRTWRQIVVEGAVGYEHVSSPGVDSGEWIAQVTFVWNRW